MAFSKFATAVVETPRVGLEGWNQYRQKAASLGGDMAFSNRSATALAIENYSPDKYLLTHCTIIASVDVDETAEKTGSNVVTADGHKINRPHADYLIKPDSSKYINCNGDAWERKLLLATYKTFVGAENYVEHIQIPELSKGKIIDAVARDLGDTVYVDILVATDRKHKDLVARIESGELNTLSMGCTIAYSICTKCGNLAVDEPQLCHHVKYEKGNKFVGPDGKIRVVAELCGHFTDPESCGFIEASWVGNPAFKGAVMRNIIELGDNTKTKEPTAYEEDKLQELIQEAHLKSSVTPSQDWTQYFLKTATTHIRQEVEAAFQNAMKNAWQDEEEESEPEPEPEPEKGLVHEVTDELKREIKHQIEQELRQELKKEEEPKAMPEAEIAPNDSIHKSYQMFASRYARELGANTQATFNVLSLLSDPSLFVKHKHKFANTAILTAMYIHDRDVNKKTLSSDMYKCLNKVGSTSKYSSMREFLVACAKEMGRKINAYEARLLIERAKVLN